MNVELALQILLTVINKAGVLGAAITKARSEGRTDLTDEELQAFRDADDASRSRLQEAIDG